MMARKIESEEMEDLASSEEEEQQPKEAEQPKPKKRRPRGSMLTGRGVTMQMLIEENILEVGEKVLSIDYLGKKFHGDLMGDGQITWSGTGKLFSSPSAWAMHCKKIVNPDKKSGCGWASVRYKGKKLDQFKSTWFRKQNSNASIQQSPQPIRKPSHAASNSLPKSPLLQNVPAPRAAVSNSPLPTSPNTPLLLSPVASSAALPMSPSYLKPIKSHVNKQPEFMLQAPPNTISHPPTEATRGKRGGGRQAGSRMTKTPGHSRQGTKTPRREQDTPKPLLQQAVSHTTDRGQSHTPDRGHKLLRASPPVLAPNVSHQDIRSSPSLEYKSPPPLPLELKSPPLGPKSQTSLPLGPMSPTCIPLGPMSPMSVPLGPMSPMSVPLGPMSPTGVPMGPMSPMSVPLCPLSPGTKSPPLPSSGQKARPTTLLSPLSSRTTGHVMTFSEALELVQRGTPSVSVAGRGRGSRRGRGSKTTVSNSINEPKMTSSLNGRGAPRKRRPRQIKEVSRVPTPAMPPAPIAPQVTPTSSRGRGRRMVRARVSVKHSLVQPDSEPLTLIECAQFNSIGKIQSFSITISTSSLLLMDFHCHLSTSEVMGYLAGKWDSNRQHLKVSQAFPCKCRLADKEEALQVEDEIRATIDRQGLVLVGWYHSHPFCQPDPTLQDIKNQRCYQEALRDENTYEPCVGLIVSPYDSYKKEAVFKAFWVQPPNESHRDKLGLPLSMNYTTQQDQQLTQDIINEMVALVNFYKGNPDSVKFTEVWIAECTYLEKVKHSLIRKFPQDQTDGRFLDFIQKLLFATSS